MRVDEQVKLLSRRVGVLEAEAEIARRLAGVRVLCRVCRVSRSAYYSWRADGDGPDEATWDEALVVDAIFDIWARSRRAYGSPRVSAALAKQGWTVNEKRVARLMGELALAGKHGRRKLVTTRRDKDATPAPDLVERDFSAERPDELWVGDITSDVWTCRCWSRVFCYKNSGANPALRGLYRVKCRMWGATTPAKANCSK